MNFQKWWEKCISEEAKRDFEAFWNLTEDKLHNFAKEANIEDDMSENIDAHIYSEVVNSTNNPGIKFVFEWKNNKTEKTLLRKDLGEYEVVDGTLTPKGN